MAESKRKFMGIERNRKVVSIRARFEQLKVIQLDIG